MAGDASLAAAATLPGGAPLDFSAATHARAAQTVVRPSLSYWQDAWRRLRGNTRALLSLYVVLGLLAFTLLGPWLWDVDPSLQDVDQISQPPGLRGTALITSPYRAWRAPTALPRPRDAAAVTAGADATAGDAAGATTVGVAGATTVGVAGARAVDVAGARTAPLPAPAGVAIDGAATTQAVRLTWHSVAGATGYRVYRTLYEPHNENQLGLPIGEVTDAGLLGYEDRMALEPLRYFYAVTSVDTAGEESPLYSLLALDVARVITPAEAVAKGLVADVGAARVGLRLTLASHPLGTDYLGRDMLARLIYGARVSLFIGIVAPLLYVSLGVLYGAVAGFLGGRIDGLLMRFADFVVALPFLLMMILMRVAFGIGGGESGILPMLIALIVLSWPSTARLVRGQILQIREEGYVQAARLMGAPTGYLVLRHMIPNTLGVILVTLTFAVPSAIFTEAFLSFIGMGVAPPTPSWGSMCSEGRKTMLSYPHELIAPAVLISLTVLAFNLLGDGLRDALDARLRSRE